MKLELRATGLALEQARLERDQAQAALEQAQEQRSEAISQRGELTRRADESEQAWQHHTLTLEAEIDRLRKVIEGIAQGTFSAPVPLIEALRELRDLYAYDGPDADYVRKASYEIRTSRERLRESLPVMHPLTDEARELLAGGWTLHAVAGGRALWRHPEGGDDRYNETTALAIHHRGMFRYPLEADKIRLRARSADGGWLDMELRPVVVRFIDDRWRIDCEPAT